MKFNLGNFKVNGSPLTCFVELSTFVFIIWLLLSGNEDPEFLVMGAGFSLLTAYVCAPFLTVKNEKSGKVFFLLNVNIFKFTAFFLWLLKELFLSGLAVTKAAFKKSDVKPHVIYFKMDYENPTAAALLSTSITLTPGTITLDVDDEGVFQVHALTEATAGGLMTGVMQRKIAALYGGTCSFVPLTQSEATDISAAAG